MRWRRGAGAWSAAMVVAMAVPGAADAAVTSVFGANTINGSAISCMAQLSDGVRVCHGNDGGLGGTDRRLKSFDGQPLEVYVILPPTPPGNDGGYPLVVQSHGWGGSAAGPSAAAYLGPTADQWAKQGYAVLQLTARGFGDSCGTVASRTNDPAATAACTTHGYIRLDDERYEARDVQYAAGLLVDAGVVDPARIGVTGPSYGGGVSLELATLKNRVMNADGSLSPWQSPMGTPLSIAAGAPVIPWSDLAYSLMPNGHTLEYQVTPPGADTTPIGVAKQSFVSALYALGHATGYYAPAGTNSQADLTSWFTRINAGEPYDGDPTATAITTQITQFHSPYYLLDGAYGAAPQAPAPLLVANGFTDDLFPVDEALRYLNLEHALYPSQPISLFDWDGGHMRGQNKAADTALLSGRIQAFFDHYVKGTGAAPQIGATALTQTCPGSAPSGGPYTAPTWAALHPGEVDYSSSNPQTISSAAGSLTISKTIDPIAGGGACATVPAADQGLGVATYRLPAVTGSGYTLLGSPTVIANLSVTGTFAYIAERLWDVNPTTGTETLVARGVYRIDQLKPDGLQVFQLHPGAWHFAAGHIPKLELLGQDVPYVRKSNGAFTIALSNVQLRLPVHEQPGSPPVVKPPKRPPTPHPKACVAYPTSKVGARHGSATTGITVAGSASEAQCAGASSATRKQEHVVRVYLAISRGVGGGRCRFLLASGKLSAPRACKQPIELRAVGTTHWRLTVAGKVPAGHYTVRADAVDGLGRHQKKATVAKLTVPKPSHHKP